MNGVSLVGVLSLLCGCVWVEAFHSCNHIPPEEHEVIHSVPLPSAGISKRSTSHLRIHIIYDDTVHGLSRRKQNLIKNDLIPDGVTYWERILTVRYPQSPITLLRQCQSDRIKYRDGDPHPYCVDGCKETSMCGETTVSPEHLQACRVAGMPGAYRTEGYSGAGVDNTDFILYVSAKHTRRCTVGSTVAFAAYCQLEAQYNRPVAGYVNLCPGEISTETHELHQMESTIRHEILHALGFSAGLYAFFRDDNGEPLTRRSPATGKPDFNYTTRVYQWSDRVVRSEVRRSWEVRGRTVDKPIHMMVTPRVQREVRRHFGCDELEGAELEDQGVLGTALTHWEKRLFENEVMTGTYTQRPLISRVTLALMEDTGWYWADYDRAEPFSWGKNLGCDFVFKSCKHWIDNHERSHPFCTTVKQRGSLRTQCTENGDAVAQCNLVIYNSSLPPMYQHFDSLEGVDESEVSRYGGSVVLADYCPYVQELVWRRKGQVLRGSQCQFPHNNASPEVNVILETYGNTSRCFDHAGQWTIKHCEHMMRTDIYGSGCYQYECRNNSGLHIIINGLEYHCSRDQQVFSVAIATSTWLHEGTVVCPACSDVCQEEGFVCPSEAVPSLPSVDSPPVPCSASNKHLRYSLLSLFFLTMYLIG